MSVPALRFNDDGQNFPDWGMRSLVDICNKVMDGTHFSPKSTEGTKKYLTSKNVRNTGLDLTNLTYISEGEHQAIYKKCPVKFGDILLTKDGANTGNCCINTLQEEFSLLSSVAVLSGKKGLLNNIFLLQLLQSTHGNTSINNTMAGQAISRITLEKINKLKFNFPLIEEQTKIANFLTAVDEKITLLTQKHDLLTQYKKGVMQQIFSQELRFKDDDGRDFPEWEYMELKDVAQINPKTGLLPDEFVYIDLESVEKGVLLKETIIEKEGAPSRAQRLLTKDDVLFQMVRPYQGNNLFFNKEGVYVASTGYAQIRPHENARFLYHFLHLESFIAEVMNRCTGTSYPAINSSDLATISIQMPAQKEQTKIANFLTAIDVKITATQNQLKAVKHVNRRPKLSTNRRPILSTS